MNGDDLDDSDNDAERNKNKKNKKSKISDVFEEKDEKKKSKKKKNKNFLEIIGTTSTTTTATTTSDMTIAVEMASKKKKKRKKKKEKNKKNKKDFDIGQRSIQEAIELVQAGLGTLPDERRRSKGKNRSKNDSKKSKSKKPDSKKPDSEHESKESSHDRVVVIFKLERDRQAVPDNWFSLDNFIRWLHHSGSGKNGKWAKGHARRVAFEGTEEFDDMVERYNIDLTGTTEDKEYFIEYAEFDDQVLRDVIFINIDIILERKWVRREPIVGAPRR